jgi:hypothetical protein
MDYEVITAVSNGFKAAEAVVKIVAAATIALIESYKVSAFFCPPLIAYYTQWQQNIREKAKTLAAKLSEISDDLKQAVQDHKNGDVQGKRYFMKGMSRV